MKYFKKFFAFIKKNMPQHAYRILSIEKDNYGLFTAVVQVTATRQIFHMRPEEILANDQLTDSFSQRDIRTLTYLGYLGINSPKYKILAQRLSENDSKLLFALKERGNDKPIVKTAEEISRDESLMSGLHQKDAHRIGFAMATEQAIDEQKQKTNLLNHQ